MTNSHKSLLNITSLLHQIHRSEQHESYNVFSVLRSDSDEVRLHSRFLASLLAYRKAHDGSFEYLANFIHHAEIDSFSLKGVQVGREVDNIDILVTNSERQALVIENKVYAGDQPQQLERYWQTLDNQGYKEVFLIYLTLDGSPPSEQSLGNLSTQIDLDQYQFNTSYKSTLPTWLEYCREKACKEPFLRESIGQYLQLIRKLTGTDISESYMNELKQLLLQDNHLLLAHDLQEALLECKIQLQHTFWEEIEEALKDIIPDLPKKDASSDTSENIIRRYYAPPYRYHYGIYYPLPHSSGLLGVALDDRFYFGIYCYKEDHPNEHEQLKSQLTDLKPKPKDTAYWPGYKIPHAPFNPKCTSHDDLKSFNDKEARQRFAREIAEGLKRYWDAVTLA